MAEIINIKKDGVTQYPITKPECVIDENGQNVLQLIRENAGPSYDDTAIKAQLAELSAEVENLAWISASLQDGQSLWIRNTNGQLVESAATTTYFFKALALSKLRCFLASSSTALNAVSFYSSDEPLEEGYMQSESVAGLPANDDGKWFDVKVPQSAKIFAITSKNVEGFTPILLFDSKEYEQSQDANIENLNKTSENQTAKISELEEKSNLTQQKIQDIEDNIEWSPVALRSGIGAWIRNSNGQVVESVATTTYFFKALALSKLRCFLASDSFIINAVSFYNTNEPSESGYMAEESVGWEGKKEEGLWYEVNIPSDAKIFAVTNKIIEGFTPVLEFESKEYQHYQDALIDELEELIKSKEGDENKEKDESQTISGHVVLHGMGDIYHFGMDAVSSRKDDIEIPSQSIFDIRYAKALGYKAIEANLHTTSDGKYVVTHGVSAALGHDFNDLNGNDAYGVVIADYTLAYLRENYRYHSTIEEYRVPITTLEEFCAEAKRCGMIVMLQFKSMESMNIARGILGDGNLFMYNAPRSVYSGAILDYKSLTSVDEIIARCEEVGSPMIYSMANTSYFDDATLKNICKEVHNRGCYVASAYVNQTRMAELKGLGFDFFAVDGKARYVADNQSIIDNRIITFHDDHSVTWEQL